MPDWLVPLADVRVEPEDVDAVTAVLESGWLTMGPRTEAFERDFAAYAGAGHAVACSSGTAALHLACLAAGIGPGDEVIVPALTFVASVAAVAHTGAEPVLCDVVSPALPLASAEAAAALVTERTRAVLVVHYGGFLCDMDAWRALCDEHGLALIEDAAHAAGTRDCGGHAGTLGHVGAFSLFSTKNLAVGEGGMLVTADGGLAERARLLRSHGLTTSTWERHAGGAPEYDIALRGFNFRLDEMRAALGSARLRRLDREAAARRAVVARYRDALGGLAGVEVPFDGLALDEVAPHLMPVLVAPESRDEVREALALAGIETSRHYRPVHRFEPFAGLRRGPLGATEEYAARTLSLPLHPHLDDRQMRLVVDALERALGPSTS